MSKIKKCISTVKITLFYLCMLNAPWASDKPLMMEASNKSNFQYIYQDEAYKKEFYAFLTNVFHLYPAENFHQLIAENSTKYDNDKEVFVATQKSLKKIKPIFGDLFYSLPALTKQKRIISDQTVSLLPKDIIFNGYLEIGSAGRYYDVLKNKIHLSGSIYFLAEKAPTYSVTDMIDRGQLTKSGIFIPLNDYNSKLEIHLAPDSIDLVTTYIGFHHCPIELRDEFLQSIYKIMRPGAYLIVRDHNVVDEKMFKMVSLAHDVFNLGTGETWETNKAELRNFFDIKTINQLMINNGFQPQGEILYQEGDPTLNGLMLFRKLS